MNYTQLTDQDVSKMLSTIGVGTVDDLLVGIDDEHRVPGLLDIPAGLSEPEMIADLQRLASQNTACSEQLSFMGAGIYDHFIPTLVDSLAMQGEFLTAYTPYQAEASQGVLQAIYEFQTMICQLTGMDVANASLYEVASAAAEAVFMASAVNRRQKIVVSQAVHPDIRRVLATYTDQSSLELQTAAMTQGCTSPPALDGAVDERTAAVVVQHPSFLGALEDVTAIAQKAHDAGALLIVVVDPISCAMLKRPGDYGADIMVAEGQPLGIPQSFGGPTLGLMACRKEYLRKLPGRIVGQTLDQDGRRAFCLTLQTREQHIRREKASSNICTNQGLLAMRATVYMAAMGPQGLARVARQSFDKAHYAAEQIAALPGYDLAFGAGFFKEFVVRAQKDVAKVLRVAQTRGVLAGVPLGRWYPELNDCFMVAVTERRSRQEIDRLVEVLKTIEQ